MDALIVANLTQRKTSSRIADTTDEDRYYRQHEWNFRWPKLSATSIVAFVGLVLVVVERFPR